MNILKLFADYPFIPSFLDSGKEITDIVYDSRKARPDTIFVAMRGANRDGHDSCMNAYENGCRDFVVEHRVTLPNDAITYLVADSRRALSVMSRSLFQFTPKEEKNRRFDRLVALQNRISEEKHHAYIGRTFRVLIDGRDGDLLTARTDGGRLVRLSGGDGLIGQFRDVRITGSTTWSLTGELA